MAARTMKHFRHEAKQHGAVAVLVALMLVVLVGAAGIVLDLGRLFVVKTELQNAADACALAAARELNARPTSLVVLTRAENAGITVGNRHRSDFQDDAVRFATDQDVTFSQTLAGSYMTKAGAPADVRYVRCTRNLTGFLPWFMQVLGDRTSSVRATAVASLQAGSTACPAIPLAMCSKAAPPPCTAVGETPDRFGLCKGQWYSGELGNKGSITGNFNWLDFTPHSGGASEVEDAIAGHGACEIDAAAEVYHAEPGGMQSLKGAWDSRFGLYKNGNGQLDLDSAPPDFTGYAYGPNNWPQGQQAYSDYVTRQATYVPYPGDGVTGLDTKNFKASTPAEHARGTSDRRVVAMPVVDCGTWGPGHQAAVAGWACALMVMTMPAPTEELKLEYLGEAGAVGAPCVSYGHPGGPGGTGAKVPTLVQ